MDLPAFASLFFFCCILRDLCVSAVNNPSRENSFAANSRAAKRLRPMRKNFSKTVRQGCQWFVLCMVSLIFDPEPGVVPCRLRGDAVGPRMVTPSRGGLLRHAKSVVICRELSHGVGGEQRWYSPLSAGAPYRSDVLVREEHDDESRTQQDVFSEAVPRAGDRTWCGLFKKMEPTRAGRELGMPFEARWILWLKQIRAGSSRWKPDSPLSEEPTSVEECRWWSCRSRCVAWSWRRRLKKTRRLTLRA